MRKLRCVFPLIAAGALIFGVACGGDDNDDSNASGSGGESPGVAAPLNISASAANLAELRSFRFDLAMKIDIPTSPSSGGTADDEFGAALGSALLGVLGDIKAEGAFVAPDQAQLTMTLAGEEVGMVQIGKDAWVKFGPTWEKTDATDLGLDFSSPTDLFEDFLPAEILSGAKTSREKVNGVDTTRYSFDKAAIEGLLEETGETEGLGELTSANLDVWLSADNVPVKLVMNMTGKDESNQSMSVKLELNVRDINSDSIRIRPPV
jgi:hypothetical protein